MKKVVSIWLVLFLLFGYVTQVTAQVLYNQVKGPNSLNKLQLKWKSRIGVTTYRTTLQYANGFVFAPSNGKNRGLFNDSLDGVHVINAKSGELEAQLVLDGFGDNDVMVLLLVHQKLCLATIIVMLAHLIGILNRYGP